MRKNPIKYLLLPFSGYAVCFYLSYILIFLGSLQWGLFSEWSKILELLLQFPSSRFDITVMSLNIHDTVLIIGTVYLIYCVYKMFDTKI